MENIKKNVLVCNHHSGTNKTAVSEVICIQI